MRKKGGIFSATSLQTGIESILRFLEMGMRADGQAALSLPVLQTSSVPAVGLKETPRHCGSKIEITKQAEKIHGLAPAPVYIGVPALALVEQCQIPPAEGLAYIFYL